MDAEPARVPDTSENGSLSVDARSTWFEVDCVWLGQRSGQLTWSGNRNVFTVERNGWAYPVDAQADPMALDLETWRKNRKSDAESAWIAPICQDPAAWRLNENVVGKDAANVGSDCSRVLHGQR